jgi:hypothetical protein
VSFSETWVRIKEEVLIHMAQLCGYRVKIQQFLDINGSDRNKRFIIISKYLF